MTEKLLQYLWNYKIFNRFDFKDTNGCPIEILDFGKWNHNAGPDFLMGKIQHKNLTLVGNIELHLRSSDWELHHHSKDSAYDNVMLHVVFFHDKTLPNLEQKNIPTLELKDYISTSVLQKYDSLHEEKSFIPCEKIIKTSAIPFQFCEEKLLQKLDEKSIEIEEQLSRFKNNYEAVLFHRLAYAFGLKINAEIFQQLAEQIDFQVIQKIRQNPIQLESLLFGMAGFLENPIDNQTEIWAKEFEFLKSKFNITTHFSRPKFLRLRPPNFPTLRLSQLAHLYHRESHLFSRIKEVKKIEDIYPIFEGIKASEYWDSRYNFGKISEKKQDKTLSHSQVQIIIINAILPLVYTYHKHTEEAAVEDILALYTSLPTEENSIITQWKSLGISCPSALESQAYLYQYKNFCLQKKCLDCNIGLQLLKS